MLRKSLLFLIMWCASIQEAQAIVLYRVTGITDLTLPSWSIGDGALSASMDLCAYTTLGSTYAINLSSPGGYKLTNGTDSINYTLKWDDSGAGNLGSGGTQLTNNVTLTARQRANGLSDTCSIGVPAGPNARLTINITQAEMMAAKAGTYTGTITLNLSAI